MEVHSGVSVNPYQQFNIKVEASSTPSSGQLSAASSYIGNDADYNKQPSSHTSTNSDHQSEENERFRNYAIANKKENNSLSNVKNNKPDFNEIEDDLNKTLSDCSKKRLQELIGEILKLPVEERLLLFLKFPASNSACSKPDIIPEDGNIDPVADHSLKSSSFSLLGNLNLSNQIEQSQAYTWILSHLEEDPNTCLRKDEVYEDYRIYCETLGNKPLNTADFGKVMKRAFPNVKPRRLGQRGQSRYCYGGMRKKLVLQPPYLPDINMELNGFATQNGSDITQSNEIESKAPVGVSGPLLAHCCDVVLEYTDKLLGHRLTSLRELAEHLVSNMYVNTRTRAGLALVAHIQQNPKPPPTVVSITKDSNKQNFQSLKKNPDYNSSISVDTADNAKSSSFNKKESGHAVERDLYRHNSFSVAGSSSESYGLPHPRTPSTPGSTGTVNVSCQNTTPSSLSNYQHQNFSSQSSTPNTPTNHSASHQHFMFGAHQQTPNYPSNLYSTGSPSSYSNHTNFASSTPTAASAGGIPSSKPQLMPLPSSITKDTFSMRRQTSLSQVQQSLPCGKASRDVSSNMDNSSFYNYACFSPYNSLDKSMPPSAHSSVSSNAPYNLPPVPPLQYGGGSPYQPVSFPHKRDSVSITNAPGSYDPTDKAPPSLIQSPNKRARYVYSGGSFTSSDGPLPSGRGATTGGINVNSMEQEALSDYLSGDTHRPPSRPNHMYPGRYDDLGMLSPLPAELQQSKVDHSNKFRQKICEPGTSECRNYLTNDAPLPRLGASPGPYLGLETSGLYSYYNSNKSYRDFSGKQYSSGGSSDSTEEIKGNPHDDLHTPTLLSQPDEDDRNMLPSIGDSPRLIIDESPPKYIEMKKCSNVKTVRSRVDSPLIPESSDQPTNKENRYPKLNRDRSDLDFSTSLSNNTRKPSTPEDRRVTSTTILSPSPLERTLLTGSATQK